MRREGPAAPQGAGRLPREKSLLRRRQVGHGGLHGGERLLLVHRDEVRPREISALPEMAHGEHRAPEGKGSDRAARISRMSDLNDPRVLFAAERTLLAWSRTAAGLMAFGFLVDRTGLIVQGKAAAGDFGFWIGLA